MSTFVYHADILINLIKTQLVCFWKIVISFD